jgi:hypothetical protein
LYALNLYLSFVHSKMIVKIMRWKQIEVEAN